MAENDSRDDGPARTPPTQVEVALHNARMAFNNAAAAHVVLIAVVVWMVGEGIINRERFCEGLRQYLDAIPPEERQEANGSAIAEMLRALSIVATDKPSSPLS